jgi:hypothetical protein
MNWEALAWAIDCEGCISIKKRMKPTNYQALVRIAMCDKEFPEKMKEIFQCGNVSKLERGNNKQRPLYTWAIQKGEDVENILRNCLPYFIIKKKKAEVVLAFIEYQKMQGHRTPTTGRMHKYPEHIWKTYDDFYRQIRKLTNDNRNHIGNMVD